MGIYTFGYGDVRLDVVIHGLALIGMDINTKVGGSIMGLGGSWVGLCNLYVIISLLMDLMVYIYMYI